MSKTSSTLNLSENEEAVLAQQNGRVSKAYKNASETALVRRSRVRKCPDLFDVITVTRTETITADTSRFYSILNVKVINRLFFSMLQPIIATVNPGEGEKKNKQKKKTLPSKF